MDRRKGCPSRPVAAIRRLNPAHEIPYPSSSAETPVERYIFSITIKVMRKVYTRDVAQLRGGRRAFVCWFSGTERRRTEREGLAFGLLPLSASRGQPHVTSRRDTGVRQTFDLGVLRADDWKRMPCNEKTPRSKVCLLETTKS